MTNDKINLTPDQLKAIDTTTNILVEAGAGSGKTAILTERYLTILKQHPKLKPSNILTLTFTKKAAQEMKSRIQQKLTQEQRKEFSSCEINTIDAFCLKLIQSHPHKLNIDPQCQILEPEQKSQFKQSAIAKLLNEKLKEKDSTLTTLLATTTFQVITTDLNTLLAHTELLKNPPKNQSNTENLPNEEKHLLKKSQDYLNLLFPLAQNAKKNYQKMKEKENKLDYLDVLNFTLKLIQENPLIARQLQGKYRFIMVDEFQDTNENQWSIINTIWNQTNNLFLVGDTKQSIYAFRGATPTLFYEIPKRYPNQFQEITLKDNFRSQKSILNFVNPFFEHLFSQTNTIEYTPIKAAKQETNSQIAFAICPPTSTPRIQQEAALITEWIHTLKQQNLELKLETIALLFRKKKNITEFKKHLTNNQIPCHTLSGNNPFYSQECCDAYSVIKALCNPLDNLAISAILRSNFFNISINTLLAIKNDIPTPFTIEALQQITPTHLKNWETLGIPATELDQLNQASTLIPKWCNQTKWQPLSTLTHTIITAYTDTYKDKSIVSTQHNQQLVIDKLKTYEKTPYITPREILKLYETNLAEQSSTSDPTHTLPGHINLLTIHASKGLEFDTVILPECGENLLKTQTDRLLISKEHGIGLSLKSKDKKNQNPKREHIKKHLLEQNLEEEKRILYVATTRAKNNLFIVGTEKKQLVRRSLGVVGSPPKEYPKTTLDMLLYTTKTTRTSTTLTFEFDTTTQTYPLNPLPPQITTQIPHTTTNPSNTPIATLSKSYHPTVLNTQLTKTNTTTLINDLKKPDTLISSEELAQLTNTLSLIPIKNQWPLLYKIYNIGPIIHHLLEHTIAHPNLNPKNQQEALQEIITKETHIQPHHHDLLAEHASSIITQFKRTTLFQDIQNSPIIQIEKTFTTKLENLIIEGRIDTYLENTKHQTIIDFKTDLISKQDVQATAQRYKQQLCLYALALRKDTHAIPNAIIYFTNIGETVPLNITQTDIDTVITELIKPQTALKSPS